MFNNNNKKNGISAEVIQEQFRQERKHDTCELANQHGSHHSAGLSATTKPEKGVGKCACYLVLHFDIMLL